MGKNRKIMCDCGTYLEEKDVVNDGIRGKATECPKCHFRTFTLEQAKEFIRLKQLQKINEKERKIIKIGNSKGITIPESLDIKVGEKAKIEILTPKSFKVVLKKNII